MEINHNPIETISTYATKENQNVAKIKKSSSTSIISVLTSQKKKDKRLNYPPNLTITTPIKLIQVLPNIKLKLNDLMEKESKTRNVFKTFHKSNNPYNVKSSDNIYNQYQGQSNSLNISNSGRELNYNEKKLKTQRKPFGDKYLSFLDKKIIDLTQKLSENSIFLQNTSISNNDHINFNIRLSKNNFYLSPNLCNTPIGTSVINKLSPRNDDQVIDKKYMTKNKATKGDSNERDKDNDKETKQSELRTDTDSKGRYSNNQIISETSRMSHNTIIKILVNNQNGSKAKNIKSMKNVHFNTKEKEPNHIKTSSDVISTLSQCKASKVKNQTIHLPLIQKTGIRLIDYLTNHVSQSLNKSNNANNLMKHKLITTQIDILNRKKKTLIYSATLNNIDKLTNTDLSHNINQIDYWDMHFESFELITNCYLHLSQIEYIYKKYLRIDSYAISDYIFNIKSNLFNNNYIDREIRTTATKKTNIFNHITLSQDEDYSKTSLLYFQRFIQNDFSLSKLGHNNKHWNKNFVIRNSMSRRFKYSNNNLLRNKDKINLSVLQKRRFFELEAGIQNNNKLFTVRNSVKAINMSFMLPEIKKLIQDLNDCLTRNKFYNTNEAANEIINAFISPPLLLNLLIKLIYCNAVGLIDRCIQYKNDFDINLQDYNGNSLLVIAIKANATSIVQYLLKKGASPNIQNNYGNTAMHHAVAHKNFKLVDTLTHHGGREDILNNEKLIPWECIGKNLENSYQE